MRKHLSVFMLYARSSLFRILLLFVLMAAAELVMFYFAAEKIVTMESISLERMFERSHISLVLALVFVLMSLQLCSVGCEFGSRQGYTLRRLMVSERAVFAWQAAFNSIMYFILLVLQLGLALLMCSYGVEKLGAWASNQSIYLAFYRSEFLHSLLPLDDWTRYLRNFCMIIALGTASALFSYHQRRKKIGISMIIMLPVTVLGFCGSTGSVGGDVALTMFYVVVTAWCIYRVLAKEEAYDS